MASADLAKKVTQAYWLKQQIKGLEEEYDNLLDSLGIVEAGNFPAGDFVLQCTPTIRFDAATAKRALTDEEFKSILLPKPDSTIAKKVLGDKFALTQKVYGITKRIIPVLDAEDI